MEINFLFLICFLLLLCKISISWNYQLSKNIKTQNDVLKEGVLDKFEIFSKAVIVTTPVIWPFSSNAEEKVKKPKKVKVLETDLGIKYIELKKGSGPYPTEGDFVVISYSGFLSNGTVFDSTEAPGRKPLSFRFGKKQQIVGLESVLANMQPGGECTCTIPPKYAFGEKGICIENQGCLVPPNETVKYVVKLRNVGTSYG